MLTGKSHGTAQEHAQVIFHFIYIHIIQDKAAYFQDTFSYIVITIVHKELCII